MNNIATPLKPQLSKILTLLISKTGLFVHALRAGMVYALRQTMRLKESSGLLWGGVPCSLLIWISMGTSLRHLYVPMGDPNSESVRLSNLCLTRFCLLALVAVSRCCYWAAEQPLSSVLKNIPCYHDILHIPGLKSLMTRLPEAYHAASKTLDWLPVFLTIYWIPPNQSWMSFLRVTWAAMATLL